MKTRVPTPSYFNIDKVEGVVLVISATTIGTVFVVTSLTTNTYLQAYLVATMYLVCSIVAAVISYRGFQLSPPEIKPIRQWFFIATSLTFLGTIVREYLVLNHIPPFPNVPQLFYFLAGLACARAIILDLSCDLSPLEYHAAKIDILCLVLGILCFLLRLRLQHYPDFPLFTKLILVGYQVVFLNILGLIPLNILLNCRRPDWTHFSLALLFYWLGSGSTTQIQLQFLALHGKIPEMINFPSAIFLVLASLSMAHWHTKRVENRHYQLFCQTAIRLLPLAMLTIAIISLRVDQSLPQPSRLLLNLLPFLTIILCFVRQSLLIREQENFIVVERQRQTIESRFNEVADHTSDLIFCIGVENHRYRYLYVNKTGKALNVQIEDMVGKEPHEAFSREIADQFIANYNRCLDQATPIHYEEHIHTPRGGHWLETTLVPIKDEYGKIRQLMGIARNISSYKEAKAASEKIHAELEQRIESRTHQLQKAIQEMETFSYSVSHDLRGPLRTISGFSSMLKEDNGERIGKSGRAILDKIILTVQEMSGHLDDLLSFSKLSQTKITSKSINLSLLVEKVLHDLQNTSPARTVTTVVTPGLSTRGDIRLLLNLLERLLLQIWNGTAKQQFTLIEFGQEDSNSIPFYFLRVNSRNIGAVSSENLQETLLNMGNTDDLVSRDLSLAIAARIVSCHKGRIWTEVDRDNDTSTYRFSLCLNEKTSREGSQALTNP